MLKFDIDDDGIAMEASGTTMDIATEMIKAAVSIALKMDKKSRKIYTAMLTDEAMGIAHLLKLIDESPEKLEEVLTKESAEEAALRIARLQMKLAGLDED